MSVSLSSLRLMILILLAASFATPSPRTVLTVAAASDLTNVEPDLQVAFAKNEPHLDIKVVTGAHAFLAQQVENGAPYDVFLSANAQFVDRLAENRKIEPKSVQAYAVGRLGLL